jgi:hypothetical protein
VSDPPPPEIPTVTIRNLFIAAQQRLDRLLVYTASCVSCELGSLTTTVCSCRYLSALDRLLAVEAEEEQATAEQVSSTAVAEAFHTPVDARRDSGLLEVTTLYL